MTSLYVNDLCALTLTAAAAAAAVCLLVSEKGCS